MCVADVMVHKSKVDSSVGKELYISDDVLIHSNMHLLDNM